MSIDAYLGTEPSIEDYWRGIVLFGRNVASYKFALAKTLIELNPKSGQLLKLGDLAPTFARHIAEHLKLADRQATSASSQFLDTCRRFNRGEIDKNTLEDETVRRGFVNVIDAFHIVNQGEIPRRFFTDERREHGGIRITDEFSILTEVGVTPVLASEVESRWRLVETAWELGVSRDLVCIDHDLETEKMFSIDRARRRKPLTSSRSALNGYQKGKCFYCYGSIMADDSGSDTDVDHFFPHILKQSSIGTVVDGVWNLVLSCKECNRGANGKHARLPTIDLLERLANRNEFLIASHHPLRETLISQTGASDIERRHFLNGIHTQARSVLLHLWEPKTSMDAR